MNETPSFILAQLNDAAKRLKLNGSTTYFEQVANRAVSIIRKKDRGRRIIIPPLEPHNYHIVIDTSLMTVDYNIRSKPTSIKLKASAHIPVSTAEAINHYFEYLENVAKKIK